MNMKMTFAAAGCVTALLAAPAFAETVSILPQNTTDVTVTAPLALLGLEGAPTGSAGVSVVDGLPVFSFDITGGTADTESGALRILHEGSGVQLSAADMPEISATVGDFIVDTAAAAIFGSVNGDGSETQLFDLNFDAEGGIGLDISSQLAGALTLVFGADDLTGAQFGLAATNPVLDDVAPVPLPAGAPLLIAGLAALGFARRKRAA